MRDFLISVLLGLMFALGLGLVSEVFVFPGLAVGTVIFGHDHLLALAVFGRLFNWLFYAVICFAILRWRRTLASASVENSN
jgi:hypothetical protein